MSTQRPIKVEKNSVLVGNRSRLNLLEGSNITLTVADDSANDEIDVTITGVGGFIPQPTSYIVVKSGGNYITYNGQTGATVSSSASFDTMFAAMITAAGKTNWSAKFLDGAYTVGAQMLMDGSGTKFENVTLDFGDAVFTLNADLGDTNMFRILGKAGAANHSHHIVLRGGHFNINSAVGAYKNAYGLGLKWVDDCLLENIHVYQARDDGGTLDFYGIGFTGADADYGLRNRVNRCRIEECEGSGISISNNQYMTIENNTIRNCVYNYPSGGYIQADTSGNAANPTPAIDGLNIINNTLIGTAMNDGMYVGASNHFGRYCKIQDNLVNLVCQEIPASAPLTGCSGVKAFIHDAVIENNCFIIDINATTGNNVINSHGYGAIIKGNKVVGGYNGILANDGHESGGPFTADSLNTLISGNTVSGTSIRGIYITQDNVTVQGNRVYCPAGTSVELHNTATGTIYVGNNVDGSLSDLVDSGASTVKQAYLDKAGAWVA